MGDALDSSALGRWRTDPASFIEEVMVDPETGLPFRLLPAERAFLEHSFQTNDAGRLIYPEQLFSAPRVAAMRRRRSPESRLKAPAAASVARNLRRVTMTLLRR